MVFYNLKIMFHRIKHLKNINTPEEMLFSQMLYVVVHFDRNIEVKYKINKEKIDTKRILYFN